MTEANSAAEAARSKRSLSDRLVKLGFLAALVAVVGFLYMRDRAGPSLDAELWGGTLTGKLAAASSEGRPLVAFFRLAELSDDADWMIGGGKSLKYASVVKAIKDGDFLCVEVKVAGLESKDLARYEIKELPAVIVFSPQGQVLAKQSGRIGHAALVEMLAAARDS